MIEHKEPVAGETYELKASSYSVLAVLHDGDKRLIVGKWAHACAYTVMENKGWCYRVCGCTNPRNK